jgi:hypothetical protein
LCTTVDWNTKKFGQNFFQFWVKVFEEPFLKSLILGKDLDHPNEFSSFVKTGPFEIVAHIIFNLGKTGNILAANRWP